MANSAILLTCFSLSLSLSLSLYLSIYLSISLPLSFYLFLSVCLSPFLCYPLYFYPSFSLPLCLSPSSIFVSLPPSLSLSFSLPPSLSLPISLSLSPPPPPPPSECRRYYVRTPVCLCESEWSLYVAHKTICPCLNLSCNLFCLPPIYHHTSVPLLLPTTQAGRTPVYIGKQLVKLGLKNDNLKKKNEGATSIGHLAVCLNELIGEIVGGSLHSSTAVEFSFTGHGIWGFSQTLYVLFQLQSSPLSPLSVYRFLFFFFFLSLNTKVK